jgi:hypothetical protein
MKTMLAMALVFGFSALGCGVPVEGDEQTVDEPGVLESALTTYTGHCQTYGNTTNGQCATDTPVGTCPIVGKSPDCVSGQTVTTTAQGCPLRLVFRRSSIPCSFTK